MDETTKVIIEKLTTEILASGAGSAAIFTALIHLLLEKGVLTKDDVQQKLIGGLREVLAEGVAGKDNNEAQLEAGKMAKFQLDLIDGFLFRQN